MTIIFAKMTSLFLITIMYKCSNRTFSILVIQQASNKLNQEQILVFIFYTQTAVSACTIIFLFENWKQQPFGLFTQRIS